MMERYSLFELSSNVAMENKFAYVSTTKMFAKALTRADVEKSMDSSSPKGIKNYAGSNTRSVYFAGLSPESAYDLYSGSIFDYGTSKSIRGRVFLIHNSS